MKRSFLNDSPVGLWIAMAAQAVNAPRLILVYLRVDGIRPWPWLEVVLLALTGIATSLVLSGGGAYLAHTIATPTKRAGWWKALLVAIWALMLACSVVLIAPLLQSGMAGATVAEVLRYTWAQWMWSAVAVLAVETLSAGAMLADALRTDSLPRGKSRNTAHGAEDAPALPSAHPAIPAITEPPAVVHAQAIEHADPLRTYRCADCGHNGMSQPQYAAHRRWGCEKVEAAP